MSKLILIEGIDCCGKSTIAKKVANNLFLKTDDIWIHRHEPTFDSKTADKLNFEDKDAWQREFYFMKDRLEHQEILNKNDVVLDRYYISGLAYAQVFGSPIVHDMCRSIYSLPEFKKPDITFLITIDPKLAVAINESKKESGEYNPSYTLEKATELQNAFIKNLDILDYLEMPYFVIKNENGKLDEVISFITEAIIFHFYGEKNESEGVQTN